MGSKLISEIKTKLFLVIIPMIIAFGAGGMLPELIGVADGFSLAGAIVWMVIIFLIDFTMITLSNPGRGVKAFRMMLLFLTATVTSVIIDNYVFKADIDQWKASNPPANIEGLVAKAQQEYDVAVKNYDIAAARLACEQSGERDCGLVHGVKISGSGQPGAGPRTNALITSRDVSVDIMENSKEYLDDIKLQGKGGLLYDFKALKSVISKDTVALVFWIFFMVLMLSLEGIVLVLMHAESKLEKISDEQIARNNIKTNAKRELEVMEAMEEYLNNKG